MTEEATFEFDLNFQTKIAALFTRDTAFAQRTIDLIKPEYFTEEALGIVVRFVSDHVRTYRAVPDLKILTTIVKDLMARKVIRPDMKDPVKEALQAIYKTSLANPDFVADKVVDFAKHQAVERAILEGVALLEKGKFEEILEKMKQAVQIDVAKANRYDYYAEINNRTQKREDVATGKIVRSGITTGYSGIDCYLYHGGWGRKELSCIMGPAKSGKSLSLGDFGKNASVAGYNVLYVSLEVAKEIIAERIDAAFSDTMMKNLVGDRAKVEAEIKRIQTGSGRFMFEDFPSGTWRPSQLRRLLEDYRTDGINFDLVIVDYADIMRADGKHEDLQNMLRSIYIDLRAIAFEFNVAMLTATQTNRSGASATTAKATDIGDDWNKARTVDILIGLNATDAEKSAGTARLYWALSRNTEDGFTVQIQQDRSKMKFVTKVLGRMP